jgi:hypothetical protein
VTRERWVQIKQILNSCLEIEPDGREAHVAELCGSDQSLIIEVKSFLDMRAELGDFLELPAFEQSANRRTALSHRAQPRRHRRCHSGRKSVSSISFRRWARVAWGRCTAPTTTSSVGTLH